VAYGRAMVYKNDDEPDNFAPKSLAEINTESYRESENLLDAKL
jgi:hypothetical protein